MGYDLVGRKGNYFHLNNRGFCIVMELLDFTPNCDGLKRNADRMSDANDGYYVTAREAERLAKKAEWTIVNYEKVFIPFMDKEEPHGRSELDDIRALEKLSELWAFASTCGGYWIY
jgi:hypothetical protein